MSKASQTAELSDDEFASADEGESSSAGNKKSAHIDSMEVSAVTDGWDDWSATDETTEAAELINPSHRTLVQQESISSVSSSSVSKTDGTSPLGSDEDESADSLDQQILQRKKLRKKPQESHSMKEEMKSNIRISRPTERPTENVSVASAKKHHVHETHHLLDRLAAQSPTRTPSWTSPWSNFGSFFSTAKQSVSTLTSTVSEGFNAVIESVEAGLGAPDPQELAEMNRMAFKIKGETSESEEEPETTVIENEKNDLVTNQDGWLNALSLEKLTTTGMKVVSGSLDVLETVGKKTFDVINEADPDFKGTRSLLGKQHRPTLSEMIREGQNQNESKVTEGKNETLTYFQLFEKHQGLVHFEALELLSNQSTIILQGMSHGNETLLEEIASYFELNEEDEDELTLNSLSITHHHEEEIPTLESLSERFTAYQMQLHSTVSVDQLLEVYESAHLFLKEWEWTDTEVDQKTLSNEAIDSLAILSAAIVEYYHKTAQLFLNGCKSLTSFSIDIELLSIYRKQQEDFSRMLAAIPNLFAKHMRQITTLPSHGSETPVRCDSKVKQQLLNQMFIQSSSSQTYASDAYLLLKPIVSQSILYHRSTTK